MSAQPDAARIHNYQFATAFGELFEIGGGNGMVFDRVGADYNCAVGILNLIESSRDGTGTYILQQRRDGRRMTQPGTMIDIIVTETFAD